MSAADTCMTADGAPQLYRWFWKARLPERRGQLFRVIARGARNSCLIEFLDDGARFITSRNALRKADMKPPEPGRGPAKRRQRKPRPSTRTRAPSAPSSGPPARPSEVG